MADPLSVRISDGATDVHVTKSVTGLKWTKVASGGHQGLSFRLSLPRRVFSDLGPADKCWVYDARTGQTMFGAAYLENPTPVDGASGQAFDISAVGGMALANDESRALIYVDKALSGWSRRDNSAPGANDGSADGTSIDQVTVNFGDYATQRASFANGALAATGAFASTRYEVIQKANNNNPRDMQVGGIYIYAQAGKNDTGYRYDLTTGPTATSELDPGGISTGGIAFERWVGTDFDPTTLVALSLRRSGPATNVADDQTYADFVDVSVHGRRMDRFGNLLTGAGAHGGAARIVYAGQIVEDLLGRLLRFCDPVTASVGTPGFPINQLSYPDGAKAANVLNDLALYEPDLWWGVHETNEAGLHRFAYQLWGTEPRYVVSVRDGYRESGSDIDLCNRVLVTWTDANDAVHTTEVTADSLGLTGKGLPVDALGSRVKDADPITLPDGHGSEANAIQIGGAILRDKISPPKAGTVTVGRPIEDRITGNRVQPWELEPGWPVLVRETGTQMRCTQVDYDHDSRSAVLTLGTPVLSVDQRVARLAAA